MAGTLSGFLAGLFGIGSGAILVPEFHECFHLSNLALEVAFGAYLFMVGGRLLISLLTGGLPRAAGYLA